MIRLEEMPFHHIMKEGVTARQDGSWDTTVFGRPPGVCVHPTTREDTGVEVQPLPRQGLIQRNPSCQKEFSAVVLISDKVAIKPCDKTTVSIHRSPSGNLGNNTSAGPEGVPHDYRNI